MYTQANKLNSFKKETEENNFIQNVFFKNHHDLLTITTIKYTFVHLSIVRWGTVADNCEKLLWTLADFQRTWLPKIEVTKVSN